MPELTITSRPESLEDGSQGHAVRIDGWDRQGRYQSLVLVAPSPEAAEALIVRLTEAIEAHTAETVRVSYDALTRAA